MGMTQQQQQVTEAAVTHLAQQQQQVTEAVLSVDERIIRLENHANYAVDALSKT